MSYESLEEIDRLLNEIDMILLYLQYKDKKGENEERTER